MSPEIHKLLADAVAIVEAANIPQDLRPVAFEKALELILSSQTNTDHKSDSSSPSQASSNLSDWGSILSTATNLDLLALEEIYFPGNEGEPLVGVNPTGLGNNAAERTRKTILLLVAARQIGKIEDTTSAEVLREECKRLGVYDQTNFGTTLGNLRNWFNFTGSGSSRVARLKPSGRDAFLELIAELVNGSNR